MESEWGLASTGGLSWASKSERIKSGRSMSALDDRCNIIADDRSRFSVINAGLELIFY